jgi:hypothetical protein
MSFFFYTLVSICLGLHRGDKITPMITLSMNTVSGVHCIWTFLSTDELLSQEMLSNGAKHLISGSPRSSNENTEYFFHLPPSHSSHIDWFPSSLSFPTQTSLQRRKVALNKILFTLMCVEKYLRLRRSLHVSQKRDQTVLDSCESIGPRLVSQEETVVSREWHM